MFDISSDTMIRQRAFEHLDLLTAQHGDYIPLDVLRRGFALKGETVHLVSAQGIFKPRQMELPLTITTSPNGPYNDDFSEEGYLNYKYRGENRNHRDNVGLRIIKDHGLPLIYFHGVRPGLYVAEWPVFVVSDSPRSLTFGITFDERSHLRFNVERPADDQEAMIRRRYTTANVRVRLHQKTFRERVLHAYKHSCSLCRLRHSNLLDAAHIIEDKNEGEPVVSNGLSLCKIHHAAFDNHILGIRPDYIAEIRTDILEEKDGPMLKHGLQEMHDREIFVPRRLALKPNKLALEERYENFRAA